MMTINTIDINEVLDGHIPKLTTMVASGNAEAILICGDAGIGKTFVVERTLKQYKLVDPQFHYSLIGGDISKIGLYKALYDNRTGLILFDDIDSVLSSDCEDILKNAINTKKNRVISYKKSNRDLFNAAGMSEMQKRRTYLEYEGEKYPNQFSFAGSCIFISNKSLESIDEAVKDRCVGRIYLNFPLEQIVQRILYLINDINPRNGSLDVNQKYEVLQHLYEDAKKKSLKLSLRNYVNALSYRISFPDNGEWKEMVDLYLN